MTLNLPLDTFCVLVELPGGIETPFAAIADALTTLQRPDPPGTVRSGAQM